jgi:hypothetical protein
MNALRTPLPRPGWAIRQGLIFFFLSAASTMLETWNRPSLLAALVAWTFGMASMLAWAFDVGDVFVRLGLNSSNRMLGERRINDVLHRPPRKHKAKHFAEPVARWTQDGRGRCLGRSALRAFLEDDMPQGTDHHEADQRFRSTQQRVVRHLQEHEPQYKGEPRSLKRDMQTEWFDANVAGRKWHARWIRVRGYWHVGGHVAAQLPVSFARAVYEAWKASKP